MSKCDCTFECDPEDRHYTCKLCKAVVSSTTVHMGWEHPTELEPVVRRFFT